MTKRFSVALLVAVLALGATVIFSGGGRVSAQSTGGESLSVSPDSGTADTDFTVVGSGFVPGASLTELFFDPAGDRWEYNGPNITVADDGSFTETYNLGRDSVSGAPPSGRWTVQYCYDGTDSCWVIDFIVQGG